MLWLIVAIATTTCMIRHLQDTGDFSCRISLVLGHILDRAWGVEGRKHVA